MASGLVVGRASYGGVSQAAAGIGHCLDVSMQSSTVTREMVTAKGSIISNRS